MSPVVRIPDDLFKRLQRHAVPLVDTTANVIARMADAYEAQQGSTKQKSSPRQPAHKTCPECGYECYVRAPLCEKCEWDFRAKAFTKPRSFTFRGKRHTVTTWKDVLAGVAKALFDQHGSEFTARVLKLRGKKRPVFGSDPSEMQSARQVPRAGVYVETNLSADAIYHRCRELLRLFGHKSTDLKIETSPEP